jgi:hypothetical protein
VGRGMIDLTVSVLVVFAWWTSRAWAAPAACGCVSVIVGKNEGVYRQSDNRQYGVVRMSPSGPPRASTKKDTVAGGETDTLDAGKA